MRIIDLIMLFILILVIVFVLSWISCKGSATQNGVLYRFSATGGCSYQHPYTKLWVPKDNYRAVGD